MNIRPTYKLTAIKLFCFGFLGLILFLLALLIKHSPFSQLHSAINKKELNILVLGTDQEYDRDSYAYAVKADNTFHGRSDTIILVHCDLKKKSLQGINIPRDTRIVLNNQRAEKINILNNIGGPWLVRDSLEDLFNIEIDHYVIVNAAGVAEIIDMMGGVEIDVPRRMQYSDQTDGINISLEKGRQTLNGSQIIGFARFRKTALGDIGRIQRQQILIRALQQKLKDPRLLAKAPGLISKGFKYIQTDLSFGEIIKLLNYGSKLQRENIVLATLPGGFSEPPKLIEREVPVSEALNYRECPEMDSIEERIKDLEPEEMVTVCSQGPWTSYWQPDLKGIEAMIESMFKSKEANSAVQPNQVTIDLKNATSNRALLNTMRNKISKEGFNVLVTQQGVHSENLAVTKIYYQHANLADAELLKKTLKLPKTTEIIGGSYGSPDVDLTVMIGEDISE